MLIEKGRDPRRSHKHRVASLCRAADLLGMTTPESNAPAFASEEQMNAFREFLRERRTVN